MYSEIEKSISNCVNECRKYNLNHNKVFIGFKEYLVFFNENTNKYLCFKHSYGNDLIQYLLNCGNPLYVLNVDGNSKTLIYYFDDNYIKENILMKSESVIH